MLRFTMPSAELDFKARVDILREQFNAFWNGDPLKEFFKILDIEHSSMLSAWKEMQSFDTRYVGGKSVESQYANTHELLEANRNGLFEIFKKLGLVHINKPFATSEFSHVLVLGGSYSANYNRTCTAAQHISKEATREVAALSTYRLIGARERRPDLFDSNKETETGVFCEIFQKVLALDSDNPKESFSSNRNLNLISNIIEYGGDKRKYKIYSAPSSTATSRASSLDTYNFFFENCSLGDADKLLLITNNQYCNYQFIPFATAVLQRRLPIDFDIIGCSPDSDLATADDYNIQQYFGDIRAMLESIIKFNNEFGA